MKNPRLETVIEELRARLGSGAFQVFDQADPEQCAVGVPPPWDQVMDQRALVYVSTHGMTKDHYHVELGSPPSAGNSDRSEPLAVYESVDFESLVGIVQRRVQGMKHPALEKALATIYKVLGARTFEVVDHWDADLCALGVASSVNRSTLVYISTWQMTGGRYYVEIEGPPAVGSDFPRESLAVYESVDLEHLVEIVRKHLGKSDAGWPEG